jgi:hypothetical protein
MNLPEFQVFLTPDRQADLMQVVKWLLFFVAPVVLIMVALQVVPMVVDVIRDTFSQAKKDDDDDDDYDVYRY